MRRAAAGKRSGGRSRTQPDPGHLLPQLGRQPLPLGRVVGAALEHRLLQAALQGLAEIQRLSAVEREREGERGGQWSSVGRRRADTNQTQPLSRTPELPALELTLVTYFICSRGGHESKSPRQRECRKFGSLMRGVATWGCPRRCWKRLQREAGGAVDGQRRGQWADPGNRLPSASPNTHLVVAHLGKPCGAGGQQKGAEGSALHVRAGGGSAPLPCCQGGSTCGAPNDSPGCKSAGSGTGPQTWAAPRLL